MNLTKLPSVILKLIGLNLNPINLRSFRLTCKKINTVYKEESFWANKVRLDYPNEFSEFNQNVLSWLEYYINLYNTKLFSFGNNRYGQLGDGTKIYRNIPTEIKFFENNVKSVSCGYSHTVVVTKDGKLFSFGNNRYGQLGDGDNPNKWIPTEIKLFKDNVKSVSCGNSHTFVLTKDDKLYGFGNNMYGELGDGTNVNRNIPTEIKFLRNKVKSVSCGGSHTVVVTKDGRLYSFGDNNYGQLGDGTNEDRNIPTENKLVKDKVKSVSCGGYHTIVVTKDGKLYTFGHNMCGQLGDGTNESRNIPTEIKFFGNNVKSVSCGSYHSIVVTKDGKLYSFGDNEFGQLGDGTNANRNIPTEITSLENNVKSVSCGDYHTSVVTKDGKLFSFGNNRFGQLGDDTDLNRNIPTEITSLENNVKSVSGGYYHTIVVTN